MKRNNVRKSLDFFVKMLRAKYRKYRIATCLNQVTSAQQKKLRAKEAFRQKINASILRHLYQTMMGVSAIFVI